MPHWLTLQRFITHGYDGTLILLCSVPSLIVNTHLLHHHVLTPAQELTLSLYYSLQELEVLHVAAVGLDAVDEVLDYSLRHFTTQMRIVLKHSTDCFGLQKLRMM